MADILYRNNKIKHIQYPLQNTFNKMKKNITIPAIRKADGNNSTSLEDSIKTILTAHFPADNPNEYSEEQRKIEDEIKHPPETEEDIPFVISELENVIKNIPNRVTPGPDNITTTIIKSLFNKHKELFLNVFNKCLAYDYYPTHWKQTKTILIPKNTGNPHETSAYRPICINSIFGKILEKLLNNRIYYY